jgi:2-(1,2-epoxy-1,2-dihydrophenyl)acetyl-CoA isomerase
MTLRLQDGAAWISLSEPDRGNPINLTSVRALHADVQAARRADAHVLVLAPSGSAFSVGGDLAAFRDAEAPGAYLQELADLLHLVVSDLQRLDAVVVSVVQGVAAGAGFPLAAAADLLLAAESARFTLAYTKVGLTPDGGSSLLAATVGLHKALELALLNPVLSAREAQALGLVAAVHPDDTLAAAAETLVTDLLAGSRPAQVGAKRLLRGQALPHLESALRLETLSIRDAADSADAHEGVRAFLEKRRPTFGAVPLPPP